MSETASATDTEQIPRSRVWVGQQVLADNADEPEVATLLHDHADACAWAMVDPGDAQRIDGVIDKFGLDRWVRRDLMATSGHPAAPVRSPMYAGPAQDQVSSVRPQVKYEEFDRVRLVITAAVELPENPRGRQGLIVRQVAMVIGPRLLLVVAEQVDQALLGRHLDNLQQQLAKGGIEPAAQAVLHALNGSYFAVVQEIESTSDDLADSLFDLRPLDNDEKGTAFRLRRTVTELRRVTGPMREVVQSLGQSTSDDQGTMSRSWTMLIEHQNTVSAAADDLRDSLNALFDTSLAFDDSRMNDVMKKLTGWAAIVAVPTLVTGFAGMNVPYWLDGSSSGFYLYLVIMLAGVVALYIVFKRKNWI